MNACSSKNILQARGMSKFRFLPMARVIACISSTAIARFSAAIKKLSRKRPRPGSAMPLRQAMREAALAAARAIGYTGAGTVEFLLTPDDGAFYFLEMNTRLQVEHPVTEMITGLDLVEWQILVAAGAALPLRQDEIFARGHAIEARIYAEDPARGFLPQSGQLARFDVPEGGPHVRVDTGVRAGDTIPVDYDPLIAKLIVWDEDREAAVRRLRAALADNAHRRGHCQCGFFKGHRFAG